MTTYIIGKKTKVNLNTGKIKKLRKEEPKGSLSIEEIKHAANRIKINKKRIKYKRIKK